MEILVTNNPLVQAQYRGKARVEFTDTDLLGVLIYVRNLTHKGHKLLTHPLSGSVKPNETFYKSVLITDASNIPDEQSVSIIGECILTAQKFPQKNIPEQFKNDMQIVDFSLIESIQK